MHAVILARLAIEFCCSQHRELEEMVGFVMVSLLNCCIGKELHHMNAQKKLNAWKASLNRDCWVVDHDVSAGQNPSKIFGMRKHWQVHDG